MEQLGELRQHYEKLLLRRDRLRKEAFHWEQSFIREFGELALQVFEMQLMCIRKKKAIAYCQTVKNRGGVVDGAQLQQYLEEETKELKAQHLQLIQVTQMANSGQAIGILEEREIKSLYRELVKLLHPDMNPLTEQHEELSNLWTEIVKAYRCNDLNALEECKDLAIAFLGSLGVEVGEYTLEELEEKIPLIEEEIERIRTTEPYLYSQLLLNSKLVEERKEEYRKQIDSYKTYEKQLDEVLNNLMVGELSFVWTMNWEENGDEFEEE